MPTWTLIVLIMGEPAVVTPGYATEAACRAAQAQVKPKHLELMGATTSATLWARGASPLQSRYMLARRLPRRANK